MSPKHVRKLKGLRAQPRRLRASTLIAMESRYAVKMLFQYRASYRGEQYKMRTVEERIVVFREISARVAYSKALRYGKRAQFDLVNDHGAKIYFEFVGVLDLEELGIECDDNEVWYDIKRMKMPMERRKALIPDKSKLLSTIKKIKQNKSVRIRPFL